ncbi:MAG: hypothetical protein FJZ01_02895 [Candidatus Sericytochromatia bacterium]|nr:hypothetical protein [Candidatus Tanganyikabacteria bacterium]
MWPSALLVALAVAAGLPDRDQAGGGAAATASITGPASATGPAPATGSLAPGDHAAPGQAATDIAGFAAHLREAIALNRERREYYAKRSGGASVTLSNRLIAQEKMALLAAGAFDSRAKSFEARGIAVVSGAFVSMRLVPDAAQAPARTRAADAPTLAAARTLLADLSAEIRGALGKADFRRVARPARMRWPVSGSSRTGRAAISRCAGTSSSRWASAPSPRSPARPAATARRSGFRGIS